MVIEEELKDSQEAPSIKEEGLGVLLSSDLRDHDHR